MSHTDLLANSLAGNFEMLKSHLADFSDADLIVRPVPAANHTAWQLSHLLGLEAMLCHMYAPEAAPKLPEGFKKLGGAEGSKIDDAAQFMKKDELLEHLGRTSKGLAGWVRAMTPEDLDKPGPAEFKGWVNTIGELIIGIGGHTMMHVGQIQVIRRKLGKKVLF
jgi:hypothetical protein